MDVTGLCRFGNGQHPFLNLVDHFESEWIKLFVEMVERSPDPFRHWKSLVLEKSFHSRSQYWPKRFSYNSHYFLNADRQFFIWFVVS